MFSAKLRRAQRSIEERRSWTAIHQSEKGAVSRRDTVACCFGIGPEPGRIGSPCSLPTNTAKSSPLGNDDRVDLIALGSACCAK